jgi:hypothetical protein
MDWIWFNHQPSTITDLFIGVMSGWMTLSFFLVRTLAATQRNIVNTQKEITTTLTNHLAHIGEQMVLTNKSLDLMLTRLLDAVIVPPTVKAAEIKVNAER